MNSNSRNESRKLLNKFIKSESLINHSEMVAQAMEAYAISLGKTNDEIEEWWQAGLLHDLDWEKYPDEHPHKAINEILPDAGYSTDVSFCLR